MTYLVAVGSLVFGRTRARAPIFVGSQRFQIGFSLSTRTRPQRLAFRDICTRHEGIGRKVGFPDNRIRSSCRWVFRFLAQRGRGQCFISEGLFAGAVRVPSHCDPAGGAGEQRGGGHRGGQRRGKRRQGPGQTLKSILETSCHDRGSALPKLDRRVACL
jgi:hypothetical protein